MFWIDGLVCVAVLVAKIDRNEELSDHFYDCLHGGKVIFTKKIVDCFSWNLLQHHVEEALLAKILNDLHNIWMIEPFQNLYFLQSPQ